MFSLCVLAARREPTQIDFDSNATLGELRARLGCVGGEFLFPGGHKLGKDSDRLPLELGKIVKCRVMGAEFGDKPLLPPLPPPPPLSPPLKMDKRKPIMDDAPGVLIKGPGSGVETFVAQDQVSTYLDLKQRLVELGVVSHPRAVRLITKGGKTPEDSECVPVLDQIQPMRAMLTEAAHQDWETKQYERDLQVCVEQAEQTLQRLSHGLANKELALVEISRIQRDMEMVLSSSPLLHARASAVLHQIKRL